MKWFSSCIQGVPRDLSSASIVISRLFSPCASVSKPDRDIIRARPARNLTPSGRNRNSFSSAAGLVICVPGLRAPSGRSYSGNSAKAVLTQINRKKSWPAVILSMQLIATPTPDRALHTGVGLGRIIEVLSSASISKARSLLHHKCREGRPA